MSEKPESEEFEDEESDEPVAGDADVDLDQVIKDLDLAKRRATKGGDPPWRRLERLLEEKRTAELTSDFKDYDIGVAESDETEAGPSADADASGESEGKDVETKPPPRKRRKPR